MRRRLLWVSGLFLLGLLLCLGASESGRLSFHHPRKRMRELGCAFEMAQDRTPDVLFFGSSRTMVGIRPREVEGSFLSHDGDGNLGGLNFAVEDGNWIMTYALLSRYLNHLPAPAAIVIEVGVMDRKSDQHRLLRNVVRPQDLAALWGIWPLGESLELTLGVLGRGPMDCLYAGLHPSLHLDSMVEQRGWVPQDWSVAMPLRRNQDPTTEELRTTLSTQSSPRDEVTVLDTAFHFARRCAELCREYGCRLILLHVPQFLEPPLSQLQTETYTALGEVLKPDYPELYKIALYREIIHLTPAGAVVLSRQVGRYLAGAEPWPTVQERIREWTPRRRKKPKNP
jgi:hypothetical protein